MKLQFSAAARERSFSKAMRRIRERFGDLCNAFEMVELEHPLHEALLVIITDDKEPTFFEVVDSKDTFFQVVVGCSLRGSDDELAHDVWQILLRVVRQCPFATPDLAKFEELFARLRPMA